MHIVIPKEKHAFEKRVAGTPDSIKKLIALGCQVSVEKDAGLAAGYLDNAYLTAGATIVNSPQELFEKGNVIFKVQPPIDNSKSTINELELLKPHSILISIFNVSQNKDIIRKLIEKNINCIAMELMPRISRAQTFDVLSSQSNLAGYKAVLNAAASFHKAFPMFMTAAGTILPARILIIGAGVAGLQAIATAKRLGAIVSAFDVRAAAKEQVQSLGANFIEVPFDDNYESTGGYAREMSSDYQQRQQEKLKEVIKDTDIIITTALIPGKPAPQIVSEEMVKIMKPGSVIIDLAVETGGNCALSKYGETVEKYGIIIQGSANIASDIAKDASHLYSMNLFNFFKSFYDQASGNNWNKNDEIIKNVLLGQNGQILRPEFF